jgi:hypothetical protein
LAARSRLQGCAYEDPDHTWAGIAVQYADGRCDGFLQTAKVGDRFPIGYYREDELPILSALAKGYTTFDNYFCSMMGPTWENRLYQITGTTQLDEGWCDFPKEGERRPVLIPGLEPMTLRDRYAKNFAEALDFTQRRPAIDLPPYDPPPAGACAAGGGWLELQASRDGSVKVICDGPPSADCSATLMGLVSKLALAQVPVTRIGQGSKVVLELKLTDEARALLASSDRMPALLETIVTDEKGPICRNVFSSILTRHDSR